MNKRYWQYSLKALYTLTTHRLLGLALTWCSEHTDPTDKLPTVVRKIVANLFPYITGLKWVLLHFLLFSFAPSLFAKSPCKLWYKFNLWKFFSVAGSRGRCAVESWSVHRLPCNFFLASQKFFSTNCQMFLLTCLLPPSLPLLRHSVLWKYLPHHHPFYLPFT